MKKQLLRIATYLLIFIMTVTNLPMAFAASAEYGSLELYQANPHFEGLETPLQITQVAPLYFSDGESEQEYYTDPADAAAVIRDAMEARQESFTVGYSVPEKVPEGDEEKKAWFNSIAFDLLVEKAFEETENATEGDSLRFCYRNIRIRIQYIPYSDHTEMIFTYVPTYFTNAAQEAELTAAVDALLENFAFTAQTTEREKIDAIYDWLCENVAYDHTNNNDDLLRFSAYAAMVQRTAVCEGYAVLFYRLAEEAGLDARVITGQATHNGENHGWNIVRQRDWYYYLDATWDAGKEPQNYTYYLRGKSDFEGHTNGEQYKTETFCTRYPIADARSSECDWKRMMNDEYHWYQCTVCGAVEEEVNHSGGIATCKEKATCVGCGIAYGNLAEHTYDNAADSACNICGYIRELFSGWFLDEGKWNYYENGLKATGWKYVGSAWYWFDNNGIMLTDWQLINGTWYYFNSSGAMLTGWQNIGGTWYYFSSGGAMQTGWLYDGVWYYLNSSGAMVHSWQSIGGSWYYFNASGAMQTGWSNLGGTWYYLADGGNMATGWQYIGNSWYYFHNGGNMATGWLNLGGTWYYLADGGAMLTGWQNLGGTWYCFDASGAWIA